MRVVAETVPKTAFNLREAAQTLGVSMSTLRRHVLPTVKSVKLGSAVIISQAELERWLEQHGTLNTPYG